MCESIDDAIEGSLELQELISTDPEIEEVFDYSKKLEGTIRAVGVHAAGVAISPGPLTDIVPLFESKGEAVTMFDGPALEDIGIIKYDILGLKSLTVISETLSLINNKNNTCFSLLDMGEEDYDTYNLIASGNTLGVFQIEGSKALRDFAANCSPKSIYDISNVISLWRPGPLGLGADGEYLRRKITGESSFTIPKYDYLFKNTHGLLVYQEQLMNLSKDMCGFNDIDADVLRKAVGKKSASLLESMKSKFIDGAVSNGEDRDIITKLFDDMSEFARYSFNLAHGISYAYITYQTAYLKVHYPSEYMAASISWEPDPDQRSIYMMDARRNNVLVLPPDLNQSIDEFTVGNDGEILFGFNSVKGIANTACNRILSLQPFSSFGDFLIRSFYLKGINKKVIDALICSGACDVFGYRRSNLLAGFERFLIDFSSKCPESYDSIYSSSFLKEEEGYFINEDLPEFPILKILEMERELLGVYISGNPFDVVSTLIEEDHKVISYLNSKTKGSYCCLCQINKVKNITTKKGDLMAFIDVVDKDGSTTNIVVFPNIYNKALPVLIEGKYALIYINIKEDSRGKSFFLSSIRDLTGALNDISERIDEEKNMKCINIYIDTLSSVRCKAISIKLNSFITEKDSIYTAKLFIRFDNTVFKINEFNLKKIDISMLRSFSRISGLTIERG